MGFWIDLGGALFGWSNATRSRYEAETQNRTEQQRHDRSKDMEVLRHGLSLEKDRAAAELEKFRTEVAMGTATKMQELEQANATFRMDLAEKLMETIQKVQNNHLAQIAAILLGYKTEHISAIKELQNYYGVEIENLTAQVLKYEDKPAIYDIRVKQLSNMVDREEKLIKQLVDRVRQRYRHNARVCYSL